MAKSGSKRSAVKKLGSNKKSTPQEDFNISEDAKKQIFGFLLSLAGILIFLSILSYSERDQATLERFSFLDLFRKETYSSLYVIYNWLGIAGALLSNFFVNNLFGYFSGAIPILITLYGGLLLFKQKFSRLIQFSIYFLLLMVTTSSVAGLVTILWGTDNVPSRYSGAVGDYIATIFYQTLGSVGASVLLLMALALNIMFVIDGNLGKSLNRLKRMSVFIIGKLK